MAELGVASSIITIVDTSWKIIQYVQGVKEGGPARQALLNEVTTTWLLFQRLKDDTEWSKTVQGGTELTDPLMEILEDGQPSAASHNPSLKVPQDALISVLDNTKGAGHRGVLTQIDEQLTELAKMLQHNDTRFGRALISMRWPFKEKEATRIASRLQSLKQEATLAISQSCRRLGLEMYANLTSVSSVVSQSRFEKILEWLSPLRSRASQREKLGNADQAQCVILESVQYRLWREGDLRSLWCHGVPGAGKSTAAASISAVLQEQHSTDNVAIMMAFCDSDDIESQSIRSILGSFLKQVLQKRGSSKLPAIINEHYSKATLSEDGMSLELDALVTLLKEELKTFDSPAYVVLDGLDEIASPKDRASLVQAVHSLGTSVKILMTSRPSDDIANALNSIQSCQKCDTHQSGIYWRCSMCITYLVCHSCQSNMTAPDRERHETIREVKWGDMDFWPREKDIVTYVQSRVDSDEKLSKLIGIQSALQPLREKVITEVVKNSENIFLLARLHMNTLCEDCVTAGDLKRELPKLVPSLTKHYTKTMARLENSLSPEQLKHLRRLLLWVAWAQVPLTVEELGHALAIYPNIVDIDEDDIPDISEVVSWSAGLLTIDNQNQVRAIHPTTKRFLTEQRTVHFPNGEGEIAHDCLHYLKTGPLKDPLRGTNKRALLSLRHKEYPLLKYAVLYAFKHVDSNKEKGDAVRAARFLLSGSRRSFVQSLYHLHPSWSIEEDVPALHLATYMGMTNVLSSLVDEGEEEIDSRDFLGATPLMYAASFGDDRLPEVKCLLQAGADPALTCNAGATALIRAVLSKSSDLVNRLVQEPNININAIPNDHGDYWGQPAIMVAAHPAMQESILRKLLSRKDINVNIQNKHGVTALHMAVQYDNGSALKQLLGHTQIMVDPKEFLEGHTPLFRSIEKGRITHLELLLEHGANLNHRDSKQGTALMRAADNRRLNCMKQLIKSGLGADINARDCLGRTVLHSAAVNGAWEILEYLIEEKRDHLEIDAQGHDNETPLHDACRNLDSRGISILVEAGARCDLRNRNGMTPLDLVRFKERLDLVEILKNAQGYELIANSKTKKSLLDAIDTDEPEAVQLHIDAASREELNASHNFVGTALHYACKRGRADVVAMLIRAGADPELPYFFGRRPMVLALDNESSACLRVLLAHGVDVDARWSENFAPWEYAGSKDAWRKPEKALMLLEHGAKIDVRSRYLQHALHAAVRYNRIVVVRRLVEAGASIHQKQGGRSTIDWAETLGLANVMEYFQSLEVTGALSGVSIRSEGESVNDTQREL